MWVFEGVWVICAKPPFLHSLDVPIKMFANNLAVLNQQTLRRINHVHCFQTQFMESCLVVWFWVDKRPIFCFSIKKTVWIPRFYSQLMVSGIDLQFTFYSKIFLSLQYVHACTNNYLRCTIVYANMLLSAQKNIYHDF